MARHHYLVPYEWVTVDEQSFWRIPHSGFGGVDLRSLSAQAQSGGIPQGYAFAVYENTVVDPGAIYLGDSLENNLSLAGKSAIRTAFGLPLDAMLSDKLLDAVWDVLTVHADSRGVDRCKPILPTVNNVLELHLPGYSLVKAEHFSTSHPAWPNIQALLREQYRRIREEYLNQNINTVHRKYLGALKSKYHIDNHRVFIPPGLPDEGWLPPATTITESFNKADSDTLGPDLTWTELVGDWDVLSNTAREALSNSVAMARADTDLSTDDHYSMVTISTKPSSGDSGVACRKDSTTTSTYYFAILDLVIVGTDTWETWKRVDGTNTAIGTDTTVEGNAGDTIKIQSDGSTIERFRNGTSQNSTTDTAITGNLRTGLFMGGDTVARLDNFEAADVAAAPSFDLDRIERRFWRGFGRGYFRGMG